MNVVSKVVTTDSPGGIEQRQQFRIVRTENRQPFFFRQLVSGQDSISKVGPSIQIRIDFSSCHGILGLYQVGQAGPDEFSAGQSSTTKYSKNTKKAWEFTEQPFSFVFFASFLVVFSSFRRRKGD